MKKLFLFIIISVVSISTIWAQTTRYVSPSGSNTPPYTSLATAANSIITATSASVNGDIVIVDDGTYVLPTRIYLYNKTITITSINGPDVTIIDGNNTNQCFYLRNSATVVDGFTIQNGNYGIGGAIDMFISTAVVRNCIIKNNHSSYGGGVFMRGMNNGDICLLENCYIINNTSTNRGGGIASELYSVIRNCVIAGNSAANWGGGLFSFKTEIENCVISNNTAPNAAGANIAHTSNIYNTIIYHNNGQNLVGSHVTNHYYNTTTTPAINPGISTNCITAVPMFVDLTPGSEDYRLQVGSPCIDVGLNQVWMNTIPDLDGNTRIVNVTVDMGAYEYATPPPVDTDGDGVADISDDYPADPLRAFDNFFPATGFATLAYEDLWPSKGDFDFNDLVVDYRFKTVTNASNNVVEIFATFTIKAFGAGFYNGFGFQFPNTNVNTSDLTVSGYDLQEGYINLAGNGLEQGQTKPTIIVYDNTYNIMEHPGQGIGVNTEEWAPYVTPETMNIYIAFTGTYTMAQVDIENFNPFIIINKFRNDEVHLPDYEPTDLAVTWQFGYADDDSNPSINRYYKTLTNLPWAINIPESFDYPIEKTVITSAHLKFAEWAESNGVLSPNWYQNLPGYRNTSNIYDQP